MGRLAGLGVVVALILGVGSAQAAQRYAAPGGSGPEPCGQAAPCSLKEAVTKAKAGDEVIVGAGTYSVGGLLFNPVGDLNVHGDPAGPMPKIVATTMSPPLFLNQPGNRFSYLEVVNSHEFAGGIICPSKGRVERVKVAVSGDSAVGINVAADCVLRDTVVLADGKNAVAVVGFGDKTTGVARNVTALATGPASVGIRSLYGNTTEPGTYTLDLKNVIAGGETADIQATRQGYLASAGPGNVLVSNSNFDLTGIEGPSGSATITDLGGNQTAPPEFVNAATGDYREQPGSPTIDAGVNDQLGTLDLVGNPRVLGAAPDIGAYEFVPLPPPPPPVGKILSLALTPRVFRAARSGQAIASARKKAPVGSTVTYEQQASGRVLFEVEMVTKGRRVGKSCVKKTGANRGKPKCTLLKPVAGSFKHDGAAGRNTFKFTGRVGSKALKPGRYQLVGSAGGASLATGFKIVK